MTFRPIDAIEPETAKPLIAEWERLRGLKLIALFDAAFEADQRNGGKNSFEFRPAKLD